MTVQMRSLSHRRRILSGPWTPASPTVGGYTPAHWFRSDQDLWQDAARTARATADGDPVGNWGDLTANADHVSQATAANRPTRQSGAGDLLNGHPVIRFDGSNDYLKGAFTTGGSLSQPNTIFAVAALDAAAVSDGATYLLHDGDDSSHRHTALRSGANVWAIYAATQLSGGGDDSNWNIWTNLYNDTASRFWHNGVAECTAGAAGTQAPDGFTIGSRYDGALPWDGDATEFLIYSGQLPTADMNQIGQYLATRYGLTYTDI